MKKLRDQVVSIGDPIHEKKNFKHCAIVQLTMNREGESYFELRHPGELVKSFHDKKLEKENKYYGIRFQIIFPSSKLCPLLGLKMTDLPKTFILVRHAIGEHNVSKSSLTKFMKLDPKLTTNESDLHVSGETMADNAGDVMKGILGEDKPQVIFSSDLLRTRSTAHRISLKLFGEDPPTSQICVLPCSNEILYSDGRERNLLFSGNENFPKVLKDDIFYLDFYFGFYGSTRGRFSRSCSDKSMFELALCYNKHKDNDNPDWSHLIDKFLNDRRKMRCTKRIWTGKYASTKKMWT